MVTPRLGPSLGLLSWCFLAAVASAQDEVTLQVTTKAPGLLDSPPCSGTELSGPGCPRRKKSATLVPSFTKTTMHYPTTTHHHITNHTTGPANHTTAHATNHSTPPHPTAHHSTAHPTRHPTAHPTRHSTSHPTNHTTAHHRPTAPANHTTPHLHTTAPHPTQVPFVPMGDYMVRRGSVLCLHVQAGLELQVHYTGQAKQQLWGAFAVQSNRTRVSGNCSNQTATLDLHFPEGYLLFTFKKNETGNIFYLGQVQANLTYQFHHAVETSFGADNASLHEFKASLGHSYQCRNRSLILAEGFRLNALKERVQAFEFQGGEFGEAEVCPEQRRSLFLPIIIGVVLLLLILIVIGAFVLGRWRSHRGYQTI
ncbi:macrosialin [Rhineura floridana]|uniref:macrosialin n=1 Tax=Rhineura floridana TaxID=261503 RepID=UPI002AC7ECDA|nr:macrosialin [Rhineura floridana]